MVAVSLKPGAKSQDGVLVAKAVRRIADYWNLSNDGLGEILGLSGSTVSRLRNGAWHFQPGAKSFELAQYLMRLFRSLDSIMGSDDAAAKSWLEAGNADLDGKPIELIRTIRGLTMVTDYIDDFRSKV
jgi:uncharacterized protein (DUF2384 family)